MEACQPWPFSEGAAATLVSFDKVLLTSCQEIKNRNLVSGLKMPVLFQVQE